MCAARRCPSSTSARRWRASLCCAVAAAAMAAAAAAEAEAEAAAAAAAAAEAEAEAAAAAEAEYAPPAHEAPPESAWPQPEAEAGAEAPTAWPAPDSSAAPVEPAAFGSDETMQMADEAAEEVDASAPRDDADGSPPTQGWL